MEPRIASRTPTACAGCHGQYHDRVHVDYRAAIDGPVIDYADPRRGRIDWVVLCEKCVRLAYELLPEQAGERDQLKREVAQLLERAEAAERYADDLEDSLGKLAARPARPAREDAPAKKQAPRRSRYAPKAA